MQIWDSNDVSIDVAQSAVDRWEATYNALRGLLVASVHSAHGLYRAAKTGASGLEHGFLVPVRDWVLMPAFGGVEHIVGETGRFLQSPQAAQLAESSLDLVRQVPVIGDTFMAPALVMSLDVVQKAWQIVQYPIPSRDAVRHSVDAMLTATKWALTSAGREIFFYAKRTDASITRTLMHTQWKVLGSGPYATLDKLHKVEVLDHICERYLSLAEVVARYELVGHIRIHNRQLYRDLVLSGLLRERGGATTTDDEWLSHHPSYRLLESAFLIQSKVDLDTHPVKALFFRLSHQNGKKPGKEVPWVRFTEAEREILERNFIKTIHGKLCASSSCSHSVEESPTLATEPNHKYPTIAQWYSPNEHDVLVDQKRHAVSFLPACARCRRWHGDTMPPRTPKNSGDLCDECQPCASEEEVYHMPPATAMVMRPIFWRFHGQGDDVCRSVWFLDTQWHGLQPYSEESAAILEDAYLFLKWQKGNIDRSSDIDTVLLTVQVASPDGSENQLVQFSSLTHATAIQKTLGGALSIFKRRVYRGVHFPMENNDDKKLAKVSHKGIGLDVIAPLSNAQRDHLTIDESQWESLDRNVEIQSRSRTKLKLPIVGSPAFTMLAYPETEIVDEARNSEQTDHLVLIVHGIGEMLRSMDVMGISLPTLSSIIDCCGYLRKNHNEVQKNQASLSSLSGRVEYLPCEWHEAFALQSQRQCTFESTRERGAGNRNVTLNDISLRTVPNMRDFANDQLMDVLYFMSPQHHEVIIDIVTNEMNVVVRKFRELTGFGGKVSLIGHSLGSIITWDILAHEMHPTEEQGNPDDLLETFSPSPIPSTLYAFQRCPEMDLLEPYPYDNTVPALRSYLHQERSSESQENEDEAPEFLSPHQSTSAGCHVPVHIETFLPPPHVGIARNSFDHAEVVESDHCYPELEFEVENAFMLGSPIPVFLMLRNQQEPLCEDFVLPRCKRFFNIFHPFDPIAYRMEPLIDPRNAETEPKIISHWNGGYRVQYQTKRLWRRIVVETRKTQQNVMAVVEAQMSRLGLLETLPGDEDEASETLSDDVSLDPICGSLNQGRRIDFMLQEREIENASEYVAALAAHSSYWTEKDLSLFVARQIVRSTLESAWIDTAGRANGGYETDL